MAYEMTVLHNKIKVIILPLVKHIGIYSESNNLSWSYLSWSYYSTVIQFAIYIYIYLRHYIYKKPTADIILSVEKL